MAFFDDIGRKITMTSQSAVQKTKDVAGVMRLNSMIADEERIRDRTYIEIGKLYVELHPDDYEEALSSLVKSALESQTAISDLKKQVNGIRKVFNCKHCGAELTYNATFCSSCGQKVEKSDLPAAVETVRCPNCGTELRQGLNFCTSCGTKLAAAENNTGVPAAPIPSAETIPQSIPAIENIPAADQNTKKCPKCGNLQNTDRAFCVICGSPMDAPVASPVPELPTFGVPSFTPEKTAVPEMRSCPKCGNMQSKDLAFCVSCGSPMDAPSASPVPELPTFSVPSFTLEKTAVPEMTSCPKCGNKQSKDLAFCVSCGSMMDTPQNNIPEIPVQDTAADIITETPVSASNNPEMKTCPKCGNIQNAAMAFCTSCGSLMNEAPTKEEDKPLAAEPAKPAESQTNDFRSSLELKRCPKCGNLQNKDLAFCTNCGVNMNDSADNAQQPVPTVPPKTESPSVNNSNASQTSEMRKCPSCGNVQKMEFVFCTNCGTVTDVISGNEQQTSPKIQLTKSNDIADNASSSVNEKRRCTMCGNIQDKDVVFCTNCGNITELIQGDLSQQPARNIDLSKHETPAANEVQPAPKMRACPVCDNLQDSALPYCMECGSDMNVVPTDVLINNAQPVETAAAAPAVPDTRSVGPNERVCPKCGHVQNMVFPFCTECGTDMSSDPSEYNTAPVQPAASINNSPEIPNMQSVASMSNSPEIPNMQPVASNERVCPKCGNKQNIVFPFCTQCGNDMNGIPGGVNISVPQPAAPMNNVPPIPDMQQNMQMMQGGFPSSAQPSVGNSGVPAMPADEPAAPAKTAYLVRKSNNETYQITGAECKIGRDKGTNDYVVKNNKYIGHNHCHIINRNGEYFIIDDNSKNHTYVDNIMLVPNTGLKLVNGQIIKLANEEFEFKIN